MAFSTYFNSFGPNLKLLSSLTPMHCHGRKIGANPLALDVQSELAGP